jgi:uncharacterized RDD family membrane protein YckC
MQYFNRIVLQTPESVTLEFILAGIGSRALALLMDYTILGLLLSALALLWWLLSDQLINYLDAMNINYSGLQNWLIAIPALLAFALFVGYFVFFETLWQGQTPGKRFVKIRVIQENGRPVGLAQATLRALLRPFDDIFWVGTFFIILGRQEKRLGDWVASTVVVQEAQSVTSTNFALSIEAQPYAEKLLKEVDFSTMQPDDFAVVREYLQRRSLMHPGAATQTAQRLENQLKALLGVEHLVIGDSSAPVYTSADLFLEAIYLAYQQQPEH